MTKRNPVEDPELEYDKIKDFLAKANVLKNNRQRIITDFNLIDC
jgi:hypothetical protein